MPLLLLLFLLNIGYTIGAIPRAGQPGVANWIATSWYMAITVIFFAMVVSEDTEARLDMLRRGLIVGALIAATPAVAGYFNLVPGGRDLLTLYDRARGTFKDPNVLGAFLILPALFVLQSVVSDRLGKSFRSTIALGIMTLAILLAFSRAAWGGLVITSAFMLALMVLTSRSQAQRSRIIVMTAGRRRSSRSMLIAVLLSFDSIAQMFKQRASFDQSYDERPLRPVRPAYPRRRNGARPAVRHRPAAVQPLLPRGHPQFLSERLHVRRLARPASAIPRWCSSRSIMGFRHIFVRVPWQRAYLAIFAAFLGTVGVSFIIDTDHWRHFWMMLGAMWGMFAAAQRWRANSDQA